MSETWAPGSTRLGRARRLGARVGSFEEVPGALAGRCKGWAESVEGRTSHPPNTANTWYRLLFGTPCGCLPPPDVSCGDWLTAISRLTRAYSGGVANGPSNIQHPASSGPSTDGEGEWLGCVGVVQSSPRPRTAASGT
eukprot:362182-Chlamydomonas_euryale.AAC.4